VATITQKSAVSSFTVPADSTLANDTYTWTARAYQGGLKSAWATARTMTVSALGYDPDLVIWLAKVGTDPSTAKITLLDNFIKGCRTDAIWAEKIRNLCVMGLTTENQAVTNLKPYQNDMVAVGSPVFEADIGYNATTGKYLKTNWAPAYIWTSRDDACYGLYVNKDATESGVDMGCTATSYCLLYTHSGSTIMWTSINDIGSTPASTVSTAIGLSCVDRGLAASYRVFKNGTKLSTPAFASTGLPISDLFIGARNNAGTPDRPATKRYSLAFTAISMTDAEHLLFYNRVNTLLTGLGCN